MNMFEAMSVPVPKEQERDQEEEFVAKEEKELSVSVEQLEDNWPYKDVSFEKWKENGMLFAKEGVPSKLNKEQYDLVRSKEFKDWFGDWEAQEGESGTVSVFVDTDTGEPQVFYRGDKSRFKEGFLTKPDEERTEGPNSKGRDPGDARNQGAFFTNKKKVALEYGMDMDALTLGKYGLDREKDHPETFPKLVAFLKSIAKTDPGFWKKITKGLYPGASSGAVEKNIRQNEHQGLMMTLLGSEMDAFMDAVNNERVTFDSDKMIDRLVRDGRLEWITKALIDSHNFVDSKEKFSSEKHAYYGSSTKHAPESLRRLNYLFAEYRAEPMAFSQVFLHSVNPKEGGITKYGYEVYNARMNGHDSYIHRNGVGNRDADEIIVFDTRDIWLQSKQSLSEVAYQEKTQGYGKYSV